jgi:hypothetical protein
MRSERESRKRTALCPECGKYFSAQGLNGHLRFTHGKGVKAVKTAQKKAVISGGIAQRARATMELVEQLKQILAKKLELAELDDSDGFFEDEGAAQDARVALELSERELRNELRKLSGAKALPRSKGFLATISEALNSGDEEEDEEEESDDEEEEDDEL